MSNVNIILLNIIFCIQCQLVASQEIGSDCSKKYSNISKELCDKEEFDLALKAIDKAIGCDKLDGALRVYRAHIKNELSDFSGAIHDLDTAFVLGDSSYYFYQTRGTSEKNQNKLASAARSFRKAILLNPKDEDSYYKLFGILGELGKYQEGLKYINDAYRNFLPHHELYIQKAAFLLMLKQYDSVVVACTKYLENPGAYEAAAFCYRGQSFIEIGYNDLGIGDLERAINLGFNFSTPYLYLGIAYGNKGNVIEAEKYFKSAIQLDKDDPKIYWAYAVMNQDFPDRALQTINLLGNYRKLSKGKINDFYFFYLANSFLDLGDTAKALEVYDRGIKEDTSNNFPLRSMRLSTFLGNQKFVDLELADIKEIIRMCKWRNPEELPYMLGVEAYVFLLKDNKDSLRAVLKKYLDALPVQDKHIALYDLAIEGLLYDGKSKKDFFKYIDQSISSFPIVDAYLIKSLVQLVFVKDGTKKCLETLSIARSVFASDQNALMEIESMEKSALAEDRAFMQLAFRGTTPSIEIFKIAPTKMVLFLLSQLKSNSVDPPKAAERFFVSCLVKN